MPRAGGTFVLTGASPHVQLSTATEQTLTLQKDCNAVLLAGRSGTGPISVTFDNTAASSTNGIPIVIGAQPVLIPLGFYAHNAHVMRALGGTTSILDVIQLA